MPSRDSTAVRVLRIVASMLLLFGCIYAARIFAHRAIMSTTPDFPVAEFETRHSTEHPPPNVASPGSTPRKIAAESARVATQPAGLDSLLDLLDRTKLLAGTSGAPLDIPAPPGATRLMSQPDPAAAGGLALDTRCDSVAVGRAASVASQGLAIYNTTDSIPGVIEFYTRAMTQAGWVAAPAVRRNADTWFGQYTRGDRSCMILVQPMRDASATAIVIVTQPIGGP